VTPERSSAGEALHRAAAAFAAHMSRACGGVLKIKNMQVRQTWNRIDRIARFHTDAAKDGERYALAVLSDDGRHTLFGEDDPRSCLQNHKGSATYFDPRTTHAAPVNETKQGRCTLWCKFGWEDGRVELDKKEIDAAQRYVTS